MRRSSLFIAFLIIAASCSKRSHPSQGAKVIYKEETPVARKEEPRAPVNRRAPEFPETIFVNDAAASKSVDGRLYYDVKGHRYWKNYKDGKYYLFNKSMYDNPDFKPPGKNNG